MSDANARTVREQWGSRFGFLMAMLGAMVGAGNIWRMPFTTGENGGGAFLVAYVILLFLIAIPGLMAETVFGSYTNRGVIGSFKSAFGEGRAEGLGLVVVIVNIALMSYYAPIIGWTMYYAANSVLLTFSQPGFDPQSFWSAFSGSPALTVGMHTVAMAATGGVLLFGIKDGIERVVKWMIPFLVLALIAVGIKGLTLPGAMGGLEFVFTPDWNYLVRAETWTAALGQALFSTGLGWGIALTFGSYLSKNDDVPLGAGVFTAVGNTSVGLLAIFAVFPAVFAFGLEPSAGSNLAFISLPSVFPQMTGGAIWAILFFVGFLFATFSSGLAITEVAVTTVTEETRLDRRGAVLGVVGLIWLVGLPSAYSADFLGLMDFMFGNWGLPLAALLIILTVGWQLEAEPMRVIALNRNSDIHVGGWWVGIIKFLIPALMVGIMAYYVVMSVGTSFVRTVGGVVLMAVLLVGAVLIMGALRGRGGASDSPETAAGGGD
ncbi:sodium-dependent transporter [Haladaptatus sp. T7]|uniref:sodium-dependent transporter n=1 Tax=Haladaptatus sp. T7 TaxID=2029368 RepID=UPI0021A25230|nr:sodium-dependent transporter [Haladaptatus sp. T7]GKZ13898.1 transporter [Haladaptatus sp. T7]